MAKESAQIHYRKPPEDPHLLRDIYQFNFLAKKLASELRPEKPSAVVEVNSTAPIQIAHISDIHWSGLASDHEMLRKTIDYILHTDNLFLTFDGDLLDGMNPNYIDTSLADSPMDMTQQLISFKEVIFNPLAEANKILAVVGGYKGHEEWIKERAQVSPGMILVGDYPIPIVENGGILEIVYPDQRSEKFLLTHNPGGGGSEKNTVGAQRKLQKNHPERPSVAIGGHFHSRQGVAESVSLDGKTKIQIATGSFKGCNREIPHDSLNVRDLADRTSAYPGGITTHFENSAGERTIYPTADFRQGQILFEAVTLWNLIQQKNAVEELDQLVSTQVEDKTDLSFVPSGSKTRHQDYPLPVYEKVTYSTHQKLPLRIVPFNGLRAGSLHSNSDLFQERVRQVETESHSVALFLRQMIDSHLATDPNREHIIEDFASRILSLGNDAGKVGSLGMLFDGDGFLNDGWKRPLRNPEYKRGDPEDDKIASKPFMPGQFVYEATGIPFLSNQSTIHIEFPQTSYSVLVLDKTRRSRSLIDDPFRGLVTLEDDMAEDLGDHNIIIGGNGIKSGFLTRFNIRTGTHQTFVAPTWLAVEENTISNGDRTPVPMAEQNVFLTPDGLIFPTTNGIESKDINDALRWYYGLQAIGETTYSGWLRRLGRRSSR
jgi:hypothetical protein